MFRSTIIAIGGRLSPPFRRYRSHAVRHLVTLSASSSSSASSSGRNAPCVLSSSLLLDEDTTLTPIPALLSVQVRGFAKNKKGGGGKGGGKGGGGKGNKFKVYPVWTADPDEVRDIAKYEEAFMISGNNLDAWKKALEESTGLEAEEELQIYNSSTKAFETLTSLDQIKTEQDKKGQVIVAPEYTADDDEDYEFDEEGEDDEYPEEDYAFDEDEDERLGLAMKYTILDVAGRLEKAGWIRHDNGIELTNPATSETIATKTAIMNLAKDDKGLQDTLLHKPGTLDHIAACVHYDFVWGTTKEQENDKDTGDGGMHEAEFTEKK